MKDARPFSHASWRWRLLVAPIAAASLVLLAACASGPAAAPTASAASGGKLVVAMTAAQIPGTDTPTTQGGEGFRFVGYQLYDPLVSWDLSSTDKLATLAPGLATSWKVDATDQTKWTFKLRKGVKFQDGTPWNADAAVFAFDRVMNPSFAYYSQTQAAASASYVATIASYHKIDEYTLQITTKTPTSYLPYSLTSVLFPSPTAVKKEGNDKYASAPVGTGPFAFEEQDGQQSLLLKRNPDYWRGPAKIEELELLPMPEASARLAALQSGEVNWAEVPPPDSLASLKASGFTLHTNSIPFVWPWVFNVSEKPFDDVRVRQALNYAIDRDSLIKNILAGTAQPATGPVYKGHPWYPDDAPTYTYNIKKAKKLLAEAGYPDGFTMTAMVPSSGSGNMLPQPMNEFMQQQLAKIGVKVQLQTVEWTNMQATYRAGFPAGVDALQYAWTVSSPDWINNFYNSAKKAPKGLNPGGYSDPKVDALLNESMLAFDPAQQNALIKKAMGYIQTDAPWLWVVHDLNSRVTAPGVGNVIMAQSSYIDLTKVTVGK